MGANEVKVIEEYLLLEKLKERANQNNELNKVHLIVARMEGIVFAYEAYTSLPFDRLKEKYEWYKGR